MAPTTKIDIVATWPKTRSLQSYLEALAAAEAFGDVVNYRVARPPRWDYNAVVYHPGTRWFQGTPRCYMVYDGFVRGYGWILSVEERGEHEVSRVSYRDDDPEQPGWAGFWPAGWYVVRDPHWYPVEPVPMKGFQGWRWYGEQG